MIRAVFGCPSTARHGSHEWHSARFGRVSCDGMNTPAEILAAVWERCGGDTARRPSVSLQLAVVQYCTDVPGTPVPTLDDMDAVRAFVARVTV